MSQTNPTYKEADLIHVRAALSLARRGLGRVWPNPAVGCVIVQYDYDEWPAGRVVGRGWTQPGGRPHAETQALARAGESAQGATAYISLEPCNYQGETPPCTSALLAAGIKRVVCATEDLNPRVNGKGITYLRDSGVDVTTGICASEAKDLNAGYFMLQNLGRPLITYKVATTLDGKIASGGGESRWITGKVARRHAHLVRSTQDAVMVGVGTIVADDPNLTCRLDGLEKYSPVRVIMDSQMRTPIDSKSVQIAQNLKTWMIVSSDCRVLRREAFKMQGVEVLEVPTHEGGALSVSDAAKVLGSRGITRLMIEGGSQLAASFFRENLVDRVLWYRASSIMGNDGLSAVLGYGSELLASIRHFNRKSIRCLGEDLLEYYYRAD